MGELRSPGIAGCSGQIGKSQRVQSREVRWIKGSLPIWFRNLMEVEKKQQGHGGSPPFEQVRYGQQDSASGEDGWDKESLPVWFRTLLEVEEKQWENGGPTGMAGRSEYLGFTHRSQPAVGIDIPQCILSYNFEFYQTESPTWRILPRKFPTYAFQKFLKGIVNCLVGGCLSLCVQPLLQAQYNTLQPHGLFHIPEGIEASLCHGAASFVSIQEVLV